MLTRHPSPGDLAKRLMDLFCAALALVVFAPMFFLIAVLIKSSDGGPVFYRGIRVGRGRRPFRMMKFRTMVLNADRIGGASTADDDPRVTRIGKLLRRYKLDELPQLLNVILGEMSLVGPRPQVPSEVAKYQPEDLMVFEVFPGMTDYSSLHFRNEGEILKGAADADEAYWRLIHPEKMRLARHYVRTRSIRVDLKLVLQTAAAVLGLPVDDGGRGGFSEVTEQWGMVASPQQYSMAYTRYRLAVKHSEGKRVLEVGCGVGMGLQYISRRARYAVGGDCDLNNLLQARLHGPSLPWVRLDAHRLPFKEGSFQVILLYEALYYLRQPEEFLSECRRVLESSGMLLVCMPNPHRDGFNQSPLSVRYWSASELMALFAKAGFRVQILGGFRLDKLHPGGAMKLFARKAVIALGLMPKSMAGKALIKRILFGKTPVFEGIRDGMAEEVELVPVDNDPAAGEFINLYAVAQRPE